MPDDGRSGGRRLTWRLGLVCSVSVVLVYHLMFFNRFFPIQEGWFSAYAHLILGGKVPYRDFYLFLQPVYPLVITGLVKVAGYGFLWVRVLGLGERLVLTALLYVLLARLFQPITALIGTLMAIVVYASHTSDVIDSYLQLCLIFVLLGVYLLTRSLEARTPARTTWWACAAGAILALAFFTKQTTGLLSAVGACLVVAIVLWRVRPDRALQLSLGFLAGLSLPTAAVAVWLAVNRAAGPYLQQVYGGAASSKGSLVSILAGFFRHTFTVTDVVSFALLSLAGGCWVLAARWCRDADGPAELRARLRTCLLSAAAGASAAWWWLVDERYRWWVAVLIGIGAVAQVAAWRLLVRSPGTQRRLTLWLLSPAAVLIVSSVAVLLLWSPSVLAGWLWWKFQTLHFLELKQMLVTWSLFAACGLTAFWLVRVIQRRDLRRAPLFALCAAVGVSVMYAHGMSYVIEAHAAVPALGLAVGALLEWRLAGRVFRAAIVIGVVVVFMALCAGQRYTWPYQWWGWREPAISKSTVVPRAPLLGGFTLSPQSDGVYERVDALLRRSLGEGEWVYCFPNIPMFYVTTGVYPRTNALVAYWDVCPDDVAEADAAILVADPPAAIVDLDMPERVWRFHEDAFRGGRRSGQREIASAIDSLTASGRYALAVDVPAADGSRLLVWVLKGRIAAPSP